MDEHGTLHFFWKLHISNRCVAGCGERNKKKICIVGLLLLILLLLVAGALVVALLSADSGQVVLFVWKVLLTESLRSVQRQTPTYSSVSSFVSYTFTNIINSLTRWSCDVKAQRSWKPERLLWQEFRWVQRGLRIKRQVNQQTNQRQDFKKTFEGIKLGLIEYVSAIRCMIWYKI